MSARKFFHPDRAELTLHRVLFALSDPTRLAVVSDLLMAGERASGDLLTESVPRSTMTHHLKILREAGVTRTRPEGMRCLISLRREDVGARFPGLLDAIMAHGEAEA
ncbi:MULTISPECIES: helix-turn-helix domain-containing protein [unclassified Methylobacterium]|uniref:ArsR/SmtB family transcription factor n=1 Tax=unclassified Methylobacterium TaxID=2615210 RepID=UPI0011C1D31D|nr:MULTISPECIES: helix-turn-helix domain-containing protein [unclassified Methylobacterium]QEE42347.1 helix-turn-helix transcriptional regulator [Methylobacterium sp. WL1]TXN59708.1 helix-turn-helix transcriptional regulator [Methylobacterium sp. WL2]